MTTTTRLRRSSEDRMLCGVSGGLGEYFGADPAWARLAWIVLCVLSGGTALLGYIFLCIVMPEEETRTSGQSGAREVSPTRATTSPAKDRASDPLREEARLHLQVRRELGPEYEDAVVESFVDKVEESLRSKRTHDTSQDGRKDNRVALLLIALGALVLLANFAGYVSFTGVVLFPLVLIGVGAILLARRLKR